jgi:hypothetical protein
MRMNWMPAVAIALGMAMAGSGAVFGQTDVAASFYDTFNTSTTGNQTVEKPSNSPGGMAEGRHIVNPLVGFEMAFAYNPGDQTFSPRAGYCGYFCSNPTTKLTAKAMEVNGDWVASMKVGNLRPFVLGGLGVFISDPSVPSTSVLHINTIARPAYVAGGGADWGFAPHFGVRLQFRDSFYKAPSILSSFPPTGMYTQTAEPMVGVYFRL